MGACLGCFANVTAPFKNRYSRHTGMFFQEDEQVEVVCHQRNIPLASNNSVHFQFEEVMDRHENAQTSERSKNLLSYLSLKYFKKKNGIPVSFELSEKSRWTRDNNKYFRLESKNNASTSSGLDTPLQPLDVRTLLKHPGCISSTPASSLDLEWEHEVLTLQFVESERHTDSNNSPSKTSSKGSKPSSLTESPWSRVSTPNSLEWDSVEADNEYVDAETEQLLTEIERLKSKTLKETGEWTGAR